jgi:ribonuclease E
VAPVAETGAADEAVSKQAFVDTLPGAEASESTDAQGERQGGRRRNRRGGRGGRDRDEAGVDAAAPEQGPALNGEAQAAPQEAARNGADSIEPDNGAPRSEAGEAGGEGRRRGRGRDRNRRERSEEGSTETGAAAEGVTTASTEPVAASYEAPEYVAPVVQAAVAEPVVEAAVAETIVEAPVAVPVRAAVPAPVAPVAVAAPVVAAAPAPQAPAAAEPFVLPLNSLQAVAEAAGLQWVNSDTDKIRAVQAAMASEPAPAHVPRERKPVENADTGPLVLVETRKDLSQIKLPFETAQGSQPPV